MKTMNDRGRKRLDDRLLEAKPVSRFAPPPKGWIKAIREGLGMSGAQLARRMKVSPQSVEQTEKSEAMGTIQLQTLRKFADSLNATLVYAIVPDTSLEEMVRTRARTLALEALKRVSQTMKLEAQGTGDADLEARIDEYIREHLKDRDLWSDN